MQSRQWVIRSGLVLSILGAAGLMAALPAAAQTQKPSSPTTTTAPAKPSTMAPSRAGDDGAAEFAKLDKNKDGFIEKTEATMEPKLLAKWAEADTNKDGKISKDEFLAFESKEQAAKK